MVEARPVLERTFTLEKESSWRLLLKRRIQVRKRSASKASAYRGLRPRKDMVLGPYKKDCYGVELVVVTVLSSRVASKAPVERWQRSGSEPLGRSPMPEEIGSTWDLMHDATLSRTVGWTSSSSRLEGLRHNGSKHY